MNIEKKIDIVIDELTLDEKIAMIHGAGFFESGAVSRLNIPGIKMSDGPVGVRFEFGRDHWTRLDLSDDDVSYCLSPGAVAMTWNKDIAKKVGIVLGEEMRGRGKDLCNAPGLNIRRLPLCGRNFEYFSEDPYLTAELAIPMVEGIEASDVGACVKHFALNNQEEDRFGVDVSVSDKALKEIYFPAFEAVVKKAKAKALMASYNLVRGRYACENPWLINEVLRDEWGYDGLVVSDWGGVHDTLEVAETELDVEMNIKPQFDEYYMAEPMKKAVKEGRVSEELIEKKVRNVLRFMLRTRMIDIKENEKGTCIVRPEERSKGSYNSFEHHETLLCAARESIVLLKNNKKVLPLDVKFGEKILVIGDNAIRRHAGGGCSAEIRALYEHTPFMGLKMRLGGNVQIDYLPGYFVPEEKPPWARSWQEDSLDSDKINALKTLDMYDCENDERCVKLREEALKAVPDYDHVIFVGGLSHTYSLETEMNDRKDITLPYGQDRLIKELIKVRPDAVIVMIAGSPVAMDKWISDANALLLMGYAGMEGGCALADVILGHTNPSGRLSETFPLKLSDCPAIKLGDYPGRVVCEGEKPPAKPHSEETYNEGVFVGYRYYDKYDVPVLFPFGYGLSYTEFEYSELSAMNNSDGTVTVNVKVSNVGDRDGMEVVMLFTGEASPSKENPVKELKGFEKVFVKAGEGVIVTFTLDEAAFRHYDEAHKDWVLSTDNIIYVGGQKQRIAF
ncbi:MAG: glycoside hydrolase family 3 C-terminal domain-containing protein [Lachnospiraceae bacterium]|nr:glycoside hydrolase family 3 C-terminal domain-containing protein [Lachnospiraceae bacterium]